MRGATGGVPAAAHLRPDFNPRAPCGARLSTSTNRRWTADFNPRAPCGARPGTMAVKHGKRLFQSTHPSRGATADKVTERLRHEISIHAPHAGRDTRWSSVGSARADFNPRAPCGARRHPQSHPAGSGAISIHAPRAGATAARRRWPLTIVFQSTRPVRARQGLSAQVKELKEFQSTRPVRARRPGTIVLHIDICISIHAPRAGATTRFFLNSEPVKISIHAPRAGATVTLARSRSGRSDFNPRAPCGRDFHP